MSELADRNTVAMVARHWGCSKSTVQRRIADGSLGCLRLGRIVRISREQVEAYERACACDAKAAERVQAVAKAMRRRDAYELGRQIGWKLRAESAKAPVKPKRGRPAG